MKPYSSARDEFKGEASIYLDANENPYETGLNRYPDPLAWAVKKALAPIKNIASEHIFLGNGSDEVIDVLIRIFCEPRLDNIVILPPTYGMYAVSAETSDVAIVTVNLTSDFQPDVEKILATANNTSKILFICSPNNPTGNSIDTGKMLNLINGFKGIVVIDEAYSDFATESAVQWIGTFPNLVVMQTFSKAWGLAAIRLGMAFASTEIIALMNKVKPPYNVSQLNQEAAIQSLANEDDFKSNVQLLKSERELLKQSILALDFVTKIYPSEANFLLVEMENATAIYNSLIEQQIITRNRSSVVENTLRITIGTPRENQQLLYALNLVMS